MTVTVDLVLSDPTEIGSLRRALGNVSGLEVHSVGGLPKPGEQGSAEDLQLLAAALPVLVEALKMVREYLASRRTPPEIRIVYRDSESTVDDAIDRLSRDEDEPGDGESQP
ncbi:effector-associated constant component EACC1 [Nocardia tengchongensis]